MAALEQTAQWPVPTVAAVAMRGGTVIETAGPTDRVFRLASITKPVAAWAMLVAVEEGIVSLTTPIGQPGCTLEHLLSHAGGYPFEGADPIATPATTRGYSNTGFELAADAVERAAAMPFADYLRLAVTEPLGMVSSELRGTAAHAMWSSVDDLTRFVAEVVSPRLITSTTAADAKRPHFPALGGIVPGVGRFDRSPWGLGFEVRGEKQPHWTGVGNSPATFGHFGGAGTMYWTDPDADISLIALTDRPFDEWASTALRVWPELSDAVLAEYGGTTA